MIDELDDEPRMVSGVAWYKREQWDLLKSVAPDADKLEKTYDEWIEYAERAFKDVRETGIDLVKVDVEELIRWCKDKRRPVDGAARTSFVIHKLKEQNEGSGKVEDP